jgi:ABC-type proline/glycine betaine transport system permease subunit
MMETLINITNGLTAFAFFAFVILVVLVKKEGKDERAQYMGYKLFSFLFTFLLGGLALIIFVTGWKPIDYTLLRVCITTLMSLNIFVGLGYWLYIRKKM